MAVKSYKLNRRYKDSKGEVYPVGAVLSFEEGQQPRTATLQTEETKGKAEKSAAPKDTPPATLSELQTAGKQPIEI